MKAVIVFVLEERGYKYASKVKFSFTLYFSHRINANDNPIAEFIC